MGSFITFDGCYALTVGCAMLAGIFAGAWAYFLQCTNFGNFSLLSTLKYAVAARGLVWCFVTSLAVTTLMSVIADGRLSLFEQYVTSVMAVCVRLMVIVAYLPVRIPAK